MFIALVFLAHIYVDLIVSATNVLVVFLSTINKHFLLLLLLYTFAKHDVLIITVYILRSQSNNLHMLHSEYKFTVAIQQRVKYEQYTGRIIL